MKSPPSSTKNPVPHTPMLMRVSSGGAKKIGKIDSVTLATASAYIAQGDGRGMLFTSAGAARQVKRPVITLSLQELCMRSGLRDATVHQDHDLRVGRNGVITVCSKDNDPGLRQLRKELKHGAFALRIQTCDRLVQDHHRGVLVD